MNQVVILTLNPMIYRSAMWGKKRNTTEPKVCRPGERLATKKTEIQQSVTLLSGQLIWMCDLMIHV